MFRDAWFWIGLVMFALGLLFMVGGELCLRAALG
jgi:hypothetical protein